MDVRRLEVRYRRGVFFTSAKWQSPTVVMGVNYCFSPTFLFLPLCLTPSLRQGEEWALVRQMFKVVVDWGVGKRRRRKF